MSFPPEVFTWIGICLFIVLSLLAYRCLHGRFSKLMPILYQFFAFEGLTQMFTFNYIFQVGMNVRNIASYLYFSLAFGSALFTLFIFQKNEAYNLPSSEGPDIYEA